MKELDNTITQEYFSQKATEEGIAQGNSDKFSVIKKLLAPPSKHPTILECGGGAGYYTQEFLKLNYDVTAVDLSEDALQLNTRNAKKLKLESHLQTYASDFVEFCNQTDQQFDQIVFIKVFHHFDSLENIFKALDGAIQLCKPNGRIVIFEPNGKNKLWELFLRIKKDKKGTPIWFYEQNMKFTTDSNFIPYLNKTGLPYTIKYHYFIPSVILNRFPKSKFLISLNKFLEKMFLKKYAFNFSVVLTKN